MTETTLPVRVSLRQRLDATTERVAVRATLIAAHLLGLATGVHLRKLRGLNDPLAELQARLEEAELRARLAWEAAEIPAARFAKVPERHRPHYTPTARFRILEIRSFLAWNAHDTARSFLICPNTILNWEKCLACPGPGRESFALPTNPQLVRRCHAPNPPRRSTRQASSEFSRMPVLYVFPSPPRAAMTARTRSRSPGAVNGFSSRWEPATKTPLEMRTS